MDRGAQCFEYMESMLVQRGFHVELKRDDGHDMRFVTVK